MHRIQFDAWLKEVQASHLEAFEPSFTGIPLFPSARLRKNRLLAQWRDEWPLSELAVPASAIGSRTFSRSLYDRELDGRENETRN